MTQKIPIRDFAIILLDDEHGINADAYDMLTVLLVEEDSANLDIIHAVEATDGRYYLPENHEFEKKLLPSIRVTTPMVNMQDPAFVRFCEQHNVDPSKLAEALVAIRESITVYEHSTDSKTGVGRQAHVDAMNKAEEKLAEAGFKEVNWPGLFPDVKDAEGRDLRLPFDCILGG